MTLRIPRLRNHWLVVFALLLTCANTANAQGWLPWNWPERSVESTPQRPTSSGVSEARAPTQSYTNRRIYRRQTAETIAAADALKHGAYFRALELYHTVYQNGDELGKLGMAVAFAHLGNQTESERLLLTPWNDGDLQDIAAAYHQALTKRPRIGAPPALSEKNLPFYRIGLLLPLSGKLAPVGNDLRAAAELALFASNNPQIVLYPEDAGSTPKSAEEAVQRLLRLGVDAIVGPLLSTQVDAVAPFVRSANVPLLSFSNDLRVAGPNAYPLGNAPQKQLEAVINAAYQQGQKNFAALVPATDDGAALANTITQTVAANGASLTRVTTYPQTANDITESLKQLLQVNKAAEELAKEREALEADYVLLGGAMADEDLARLEALRKSEPTALIDFDALILPIAPSRVPLLLAQLAFYDVNTENTPIYGLSSWEALSTAGSDLYGLYYPQPAPDSETFSQRFTKAYGRTPTGPAELGYAAIESLNQALILAGGSPRNTPKTLTSHVFSTVAGDWRFSEDGQILRSYSLKKLRRTPEEVLAAPALLPPAIPSILVESRQPFGYEEGW